jgi:Flp pilus assembly protein CpaB
MDQNQDCSNSAAEVVAGYRRLADHVDSLNPRKMTTLEVASLLGKVSAALRSIADREQTRIEQIENLGRMFEEGKAESLRLAQKVEEYRLNYIERRPK